MTDFVFQPIGHVRSPYLDRIDAPHQPTVVQGTASGRVALATLEMVPGFQLEALADLEGFERIWLVFVFHRSQGWTPKVRPPRGGGKRGVLATRSPHRPNAIGLSAVQLLGVDGNRLELSGVDVLDGTPVIDIKPYVPYADAFPESKAGWIDALDLSTGRDSAPGPRRPRRSTSPI